MEMQLRGKINRMHLTHSHLWISSDFGKKLEQVEQQHLEKQQLRANSLLVNATNHALPVSQIDSRVPLSSPQEENKEEKFIRDLEEAFETALLAEFEERLQKELKEKLTDELEKEIETEKGTERKETTRENRITVRLARGGEKK